MIYADYEYYAGTYGGDMPAERFAFLSRQASAYIDRATFERIDMDALSDELKARVKNACCAVAEAYLLNEQGGGVAAESNDGVSVSYVVGISTAKTYDQRLRDALFLYLGNSGLLYRGVD